MFKKQSNWINLFFFFLCWWYWNGSHIFLYKTPGNFPTVCWGNILQALPFGFMLTIKIRRCKHISCFILMKLTRLNFLLVAESRLLVLLGKPCLACPVMKKIRFAVRLITSNCIIMIFNYSKYWLDGHKLFFNF